MASPAFGSIGAQLEGSAQDFSVAVPSGVANTDIIVVTAFIDSNITVTGMPAGFANVTGSPVFNNAASGNHRQYIMWKRASGADTGTYDFTTSGPAFRSVAAARYTGAITTGDPWDVTAFAIDTTGGAASPAVSVITTVADTLLVYSSTNWNGGTWTAPSGFTQRRGSGAGVCTSDDKAQAAIGSSGSVSASCTGAGKSTAWLGALKSPGAPPVTVSPNLSETYYANQLAGTIVNGIPTLTFEAALCVYAGVPITSDVKQAANALNSDTLPSGWLEVEGALNKKAGTSGLTIQQCLYKLLGGT